MNINDLLKKIKGDKNDVEEAFNKAVETAKGKASGFSTFILVTDKQQAVCGSGADLLALIGSIINNLSKEGLPKEDMLEVVEMAYMSDEELEKEAKERLKKTKNRLEELKGLEDILKKFEELEEDEDDDE